MHKYLLIAAIVLSSTAAYAGMTRGLTLVTDQQNAPDTGQANATTPSSAPAQPNVAPQVQPQAPATQAQPTTSQSARGNDAGGDTSSAHRQRASERHRTRTTDATRIIHELRRFGVW